VTEKVVTQVQTLSYLVRRISIERFRSHHNSLNTELLPKKTGAEEKNRRRYKPQIAGSSFLPHIGMPPPARRHPLKP
jgi:hypothetical protein